jgi:hypothetical protein
MGLREEGFILAVALMLNGLLETFHSKAIVEPQQLLLWGRRSQSHPGALHLPKFNRCRDLTVIMLPACSTGEGGGLQVSRAAES